MSNEKLPIVCFHGSPGTPDDFLELAKHLPGHPLVRLLRKGYPEQDFDGQQTIARQGAYPPAAHFLGYSWGAAACLVTAAQEIARVRSLILIAPYVFAKPSSPLKRLLVQAPLIGELLIKKTGPKAVAELLAKSSAPCEVPTAYQRLADKLAHPQVLRRALTEREDLELPIADAMAAVGQARAPVAIIWGDGDLTSSEAEQIAPLRQRLAPLHEKKFTGAGHALLWTHAAELADEIAAFLDRL